MLKLLLQLYVFQTVLNLHTTEKNKNIEVTILQAYMYSLQGTEILYPRNRAERVK